jgi:signal transduction histidine kinase
VSALPEFEDLDFAGDDTPSLPGDDRAPAFGASGNEDAQALRRRLTRIAFDLHDGALQDVAALLGDVRQFRTRADAADEVDDFPELVAGLLEDLEARLVNVDETLRALIRGEELAERGGDAVHRSLEEQLHEFHARTGIEAVLRLDGDFDGLTPSQAIALQRVVQTALANVAQHSGAEHVAVKIRRAAGRIDAEVLDDGRGFDFDEALLRAVREGRLGLAGIAERVRLLGGEVAVESTPGERGTRISIRLPEWRGDND